MAVADATRLRILCQLESATALANLAAVVLSPVLLGLMLSGGGVSLPAAEEGRVVVSLVLTMRVPVLAGQAVRWGIRPAGRTAETLDGRQQRVDSRYRHPRQLIMAGVVRLFFGSTTRRSHTSTEN